MEKNIWLVVRTGWMGNILAGPFYDDRTAKEFMSDSFPHIGSTIYDSLEEARKEVETSLKK